MDSSDRHLSAGRSCVPIALTQTWVATIVGDDLRACLEPEVRVLPIDPHDFSVTLECQPPHLFLMESAGWDYPGAWSAALSDSEPECPPELDGILRWCRARGVPTVFWNVDGTNAFERWRAISGRFDLVCAASRDVYRQYLAARPALSARLVHLPLAVQPKRARPLPRAYDASRRVGCLDLVGLRLAEDRPLPKFGRRLPAPTDLWLMDLDRTWAGAFDDEHVTVHYRRLRCVADVDQARSACDFFLHCPIRGEFRHERRRLDLLASGAFVRNANTGRFDPTVADIPLVRAAVADRIGPDPSCEEIRALLRPVQSLLLSAHTYGHRLQQLLRHAGLAIADSSEAFAAVALVDALDDLDPLVAFLRHQQSHPSQLVVGTTIAAPPPELLEALTQACPLETHVELVSQSPAPDHARFAELAGLCTVDHTAVLVPHAVATYAPDHFASLLLSERCCDADVVGIPRTIHPDALPFSYVDRLSPENCLVGTAVLRRFGWPTTDQDADAMMPEMFRVGVRLFQGDAIAAAAPPLAQQTRAASEVVDQHDSEAIIESPR